MDIHPKLVQVIHNELGKNTADLFVKFYTGFPAEEQLRGAKDILSNIVGPKRTTELLKEVMN